MEKSASPWLIAVLLAATFVSAQATKSAHYPYMLGGELPMYPPVAKTARVSGTVQVRVTVENGQVIAVAVISGNPLLASATTDNVRTWKFAKEANSTFLSTFLYRLEKSETSEPSNPRIDLELPKLVTITARPSKQPCHDCGSDISAKPVAQFREAGPR